MPAYISFGNLGATGGESSEKGSPAWKSILAGAWFSYGVISPGHSILKMPGGTRYNQPITIRKVVDGSTPQLIHALLTGGNLSGTIEIYKGGAGSGSKIPNNILKLSGGVIHSIKRVPSGASGLSTITRGLSSPRELEEVAMTFQEITWTWSWGGASAGDLWKT
jgi:type VI secretion system Hcp family effector